MKKDVTLVLLAGGKGWRFKGKKQFVSLIGKPVIQYSIDVFEKFVDEIIIVSDIPYKEYQMVEAGESRQESVYNGLKAVKTKYVIIHEAVRPFITEEIVEEIKYFLFKGERSVAAGIALTDGFLFAGAPMKKSKAQLIQTPEAFVTEEILEAYQKVKGRSFQDSTALLFYQATGISPTVVEGVYINNKLTFPQDIFDFEGIMKSRKHNTLETSIDVVGRQVLVLGAGGGIGSAVADRLERVGALVQRFRRTHLDLSREFEVNLVGVDAVVYAAGEYKNEAEIMAVNFEACVHLMRTAREHNWKGNMVFLGSTCAMYGRKNIPIYSASKAALNAAVESMHEELAGVGIYVNVIAPAKVDTSLQEHFNPGCPKEDMLTPIEVAEAILPYVNTKKSGDIIYMKVIKK